MAGMSTGGRLAALIAILLFAAAPLIAAAHVISTHPRVVDCSAAIAIAVSVYNHTNTSVICNLFSGASNVLCCARSAARAPPPATADDARAAASLLAPRAQLSSVVVVEGLACAALPTSSNSCTVNNIDVCACAAAASTPLCTRVADPACAASPPSRSGASICISIYNVGIIGSRVD
jgi:hypothetical protein